MEQYFKFYLQNCVVETVELIMKKYNYNEMDALNVFLNSETYKYLEDRQMKMWQFGNLAIFDLWESEKVTGSLQNSVYLRSE